MFSADNDPVVNAFLTLMPADYVLSTLPSDHIQHARLLAAFRMALPGTHSVQLSWAPQDGAFALWLVFQDRRGSLGVISVALSELNIDISKAAAFSTQDGIAVDAFVVNRMNDDLALALRNRLAAVTSAPSPTEEAAEMVNSQLSLLREQQSWEHRSLLHQQGVPNLDGGAAPPRTLLTRSSRPVIDGVDGPPSLPCEWGDPLNQNQSPTAATALPVVAPMAPMAPLAPLAALAAAGPTSPTSGNWEGLVSQLEFDMNDVITLLEDQALESDASTNGSSSADEGTGPSLGTPLAPLSGDAPKRRAPPVTRWNLTPEQRQYLEAFYAEAPLPSRAARQVLADKMGVTLQQIKVWFRNRRQRDRLSKRTSGEGLGSLGSLAQSGNSSTPWESWEQVAAGCDGVAK